VIIGKVFLVLEVINDIIHLFGKRTEEDGCFSLRFVEHSLKDQQEGVSVGGGGGGASEV